MANIEINEALWNGVSDADKAQITANLKKHRLLMDGDKITGNRSIPAPDSSEEGFFDNPGKEFCRIGCDAAAAAVAATAGLAPVALAAALVVIAAARQACRDSC